MEFEEALALVRTGQVRPGGIGILKEKTLHATLKLWLDEDMTHHEMPLPEGCVADIFDGVRVTEIQTGNFSGFRPKLQKLLESYPVTVVYPLVRRKWVRWIHPETGEATPPRRSPKTGTWTDAGAELIYILPCLTHPNLTLRLVLLDVEEQRLADGWSRDGKRGSHRADRLPVALGDSVTLHAPADYRVLLPEGLPDTFTAAQFGKLSRLQGRKLNGTLKLLMALELVTREKVGREFRYTVGE
ncbi:MAG: hypothetical protein IJ518_04615 [Clostridia bacterium]|nr:hypothetical protein [Clostridia bacterium]